jgi:membrane protease YdiL (CAAX protease family)
MATFTAPIVEEVIYRGILYSAFQRARGSGVAIAAVTLLFALVHVPQYYPSFSHDRFAAVAELDPHADTRPDK